MSRLDDLKSKVSELVDTIKQSESFQQVRAKYDELDNDAKLYINLGGLGVVILLVVVSILSGISKVNGLKSDMDTREEIIGYLQNAADNLKRLKAQFESSKGNQDLTTPLKTFAEGISRQAGLDDTKFMAGTEKNGSESTKDIKETLLDLKFNQINLKQLTRILFDLTDKGAARNLNIKDLSVNTKEGTGILDVSILIATYTAAGK